MEIFMIISWLIFCFVVGFVGSGRKIGFGGAFFCSLFLSPLIGLIITLVSKNKADEEYKEKVLVVQQSQQEALERLSETKTISNVTDELQKIKSLLDSGVINQEEFAKMKSRIIESIDKPQKLKEIKNVDAQKITINSQVVELKTGNQYRVVEIENNMYICTASSGILKVQFAENEIELFSVWVEKYKKNK